MITMVLKPLSWSGVSAALDHHKTHVYFSPTSDTRSSPQRKGTHAPFSLSSPLPFHLLPTLLQRGKELTPFLRRQPCRENAGGSSFHTLLILPKKKGHLSAWEDCGTSAWGHFYSRSRRKQPPSPLFPQVLPLTGEDGREAASLLRPCGLHSGGGSRVWLLEAGLGALSSLLHSLAALLCPYWVY